MGAPPGARLINEIPANEWPDANWGFCENPAQLVPILEASNYWPGWFGAVQIGGRLAVLPYSNGKLQQNVTGIGQLATQPPNTFLKELPGSGEVQFGEDCVGTRIFEVPWAWYPDVMTNLLGGYSGFDGDGFPLLQLPDVFSTQFPFLICVDVKASPQEGLMRGIDDDTPPRITYERMKLTATYRPLDYETTIETAGKIFSLPKQYWGWAGYSLKDIAGFSAAQEGKVQNDVAMIVPNGEFSLTKRMFIPSMLPTLMALEGKVNSLPFLGYPTGTLQMESISGKPTWLPNGMQVWRIQCKLLHDPHTHVANLNPQTFAASGNLPSRGSGWQFMQLQSWANITGGDISAAEPLVDFQGNTIYDPLQPGGPGLQVPILDLGLTHLLADFNVLLGFL